MPAERATVAIARWVVAAALGLAFVRPARAEGPSSEALTSLTLASAAYVASALAGAHIAIRDSLVEHPFGLSFEGSARDGFFRGGGTALSPGLPMLATQAVVTALTYQPAPAGETATTVLGVGGLYFIGQLSEPETYRILGHPGRAGFAKVAVVTGNLVLPALIVAASVKVHDQF